MEGRTGLSELALSEPEAWGERTIHESQFSSHAVTLQLLNSPTSQLLLTNHLSPFRPPPSVVRQGTSTIFPNAPDSMTARCACGASASLNSLPITGRNVPFSKPATSAA